MTRLFVRFAALLLAVLSSAAAPAADPNSYPSQSIKIFVPFPPGSGADTSARFFGQQLAAVLKQPVVVENRVGANGVIAVEAAKRAAPDGYTLLMGTNSVLSVNPFFIKRLPYKPLEDFKPISGLTKSMMVVVVGASSRFKTIGELLVAAKADPNGLKIGTFSAGYRIAGAWLASAANVNVLDVPYSGVAQVMAGLVSGELDFSIVDMSSARPLIEGGRIRALAVTGEQRYPGLPAVPTVAENGFKSYVTYTWNGFYVPKGTPDAVVNVLARAMKEVVHSPSAAEYANQIQAEVLTLGPQEMNKFLAGELERLGTVAKHAKFEPQ